MKRQGRDMTPNLPDWGRASLAQGEARIPGPNGERYAELMRRGGLSVELYAPRGIDAQTPHARDEVYVVQRGEGWFVHGASRDRFGPGDVLFVAAGVPHRFDEFSDDLLTWVLFYGPEGGER
jgi:mannose-6-phosphate isomerase-like protein (cupin superfamily)